MRNVAFGGRNMSRAFNYLLLCLFFIVGTARTDIVAETQQQIDLVDKAIGAAEDAWVKASAQVKVYQAAIDALEAPDTEQYKIASRNQDDLEAQVTQLSSILDQLHAKRLELSWALEVYKRAVATKQLEAIATSKITDYKSSYTAQISSMSSQFKVIEDGIIQIQGALDSPAFSDAQAVAVSDAKGRVQGAIIGLESAMSGLIDIDTKINSDMPSIQQISQSIASGFQAWWQQQQAWATQTKTALATRKEVVASVDSKLLAKQQAYQAQMARQAQLDVAATELQQKKNEALTVFKNLVQTRAKIIQQMADLVGVITSTLATADQAIAAATGDEDLGGILAQAQATTNNMIDIGDFQRIFSSTESALVDAMNQMQALFNPEELAEIKSAVSAQSTWMQGFSATLQALRDQSANIRKKLDDKRAQLAQIIADGKTKNAAAYGASIQQLIQIITQIDSEASALIRDILTPLVLGLSQKVVGLSALFDAQSPSETTLNAIKSALDEVGGDCAHVESSIKEFNLWSKMIDDYGAMIDQKLTDATLKTTLANVRKNFTDWNVWVSGVSTRQQSITNTINTAKTRYGTLVTTAKSIQDASYALELSLKQAQASLDALTQKKSTVDASFKKVSDAVSGLTVVAGADGVLTQLTTFLTSLADLESDTKKTQDLINGLLPAGTPQQVIDKSSAQVGKIKDTIAEISTAVKKMRLDTDSLKDTATNKKTSLTATAAAAAQADAEKQAKMLADQKALDATAQSLSTFVGGAKKDTADFAALKTILDGFGARVDAAKTDEAANALSSELTKAKNTFATLQASLKQLLITADQVQASMDQDRAANRNVSSESVQSLADQKAALAQVQKEFDAYSKILDDSSKRLDSLTSDVQKRKDALDLVKSQTVQVTQKITTLGSYLTQIKDAIAAANNTLSNGAVAADFDAALSKLTAAENLKNMITQEKISGLQPAFDTLTKTTAANFKKSFGDLPADISGSIDQQTSWIGAVDTSVNTFMDTIAGLKTQLTAKRDQTSQDDLKSFGEMSFAKQLQDIESTVPNASAAARVEGVMRKIDYVVKNRYGTKDEDKDPNVINGNKARLLRLIDWVLKNTRFASKRASLTIYRKEVAG